MRKLHLAQTFLWPQEPSAKYWIELKQRMQLSLSALAISCSLTRLSMRGLPYTICSMLSFG